MIRIVYSPTEKCRNPEVAIKEIDADIGSSGDNVIRYAACLDDVLAYYAACVTRKYTVKIYWLDLSAEISRDDFCSKFMKYQEDLVEWLNLIDNNRSKETQNDN